ncbi:MAG: FimV/HubP family polar landmark protein, partial [Pseudomonadota bacterium]
VQDQRTYTVQSGDNLWDIATKYGPVGANANLYQILLSLYELNRDSFINGNISLLKYGVTLQLPATADVASINAETAQSLFEQRWSEGSERIGMAQRGEPLPPLSSIFAPEVVKPEINPTAGLQEAPEEPFIEQNNGGLLITSSNAPVIPNQAITPAQIQAGSTLSGQAGVSSASNTVGTNVPATGTAGPNTLTVTSTNPYLEGVNTSAQVMQDMLAERQQQVAMLEAQMDEMSTRMLEISRVTERLNTSLEEAIAERDSQQENILRSNLLMGGLVLALSAALVVIVVMILKLAAQLRVQHELLQNSMRVQPPAAPKVSRFTDRPGQTKNAAEKTGVEKFRKHISPEQAALAVPIIEDEEESEERTESANSKDKDQQIAPSSVKQEQTDVELGDMELDPTEENEVPRSR